jgi:hypothetical protein
LKIARFPITFLIFIAGAICFGLPLHSQQINVDTASARAVLKALQDPKLTYEQAMSIARLDGNQGMIREMRELAEADTDQQFARALVAAAHDQVAGNAQEEHYNFPSVKASTASVLFLLDQVEHGFGEEIRSRILPYAAKAQKASVRGFVVAGGDGAGYAFGDEDFYINIANNDDILMVKQVMIHEAYHGIQGAAYHEDTNHWSKTLTGPADLIRGRFCSQVAELFMDMRNEGTAMYVAPDEMLRNATGPTGKRLYAEYLYGKNHLDDSAGLLEISVASLQAPHPAPYKLVYNIDFFGRGIVYYVSSAMAGAIADIDGPGAIGEVIQQPGYEFVLRYTRLMSYGKDPAHPRLGENIVHAAQMLHDGCPAS